MPRLVSLTLAFALQLSKKHGKTSVRVVKECCYPLPKHPHNYNTHHTHTHNITKSPTHPYITKPTERITTFGDLDLFPSLVRGCVAISGFISTERSVALGPEATTTQPYFDFC